MFRNYGFLRISTGKSISKSYGWCIFHFFRNLPPLFPIGCAPLHSPNSVGGFPFLYTVLSVRRLLEDGHSAWWEVIPCGPFDLHFSTNKLCWASFHVLFFFFLTARVKYSSVNWLHESPRLWTLLSASTGISLMGKCHVQCPSPCDY